MYDPLTRSDAVKRKVCRSRGGVEERLYFRFRGGGWYGGVSSGDVIGCNLSCKFCWAWRFRDRYEWGKFYTPTSSYAVLRKIAEKHGYDKVRLTGGEPTLCRDHLISLIQLAMHDGYTFIVETNGILLGHDKTYARELSRFDNVLVRVSFKGVNRDEFALLTGADPIGFDLQLSALKNLLKSGLEPCRNVLPAVMISFSNDVDIAKFVVELSSMDEKLSRCIDWEVVIMYPHVKSLLKKYGLKPKRFINP
jgi:uncharacterized Fe-S cluster-containing radical SAM superfamily protein